MRYQIDPDWLIDCDDSSCQLIRLRTITGENARGKKPSPENIGKQREEGMGFYANLEQALVHGYLVKSVQTSAAQGPGSDHAQALAVIQEIRRAQEAVIVALKGWRKPGQLNGS